MDVFKTIRLTTRRDKSKKIKILWSVLILVPDSDTQPEPCVRLEV